MTAQDIAQLAIAKGRAPTGAGLEGALHWCLDGPWHCRPCRATRRPVLAGRRQCGHRRFRHHRARHLGRLVVAPDHAQPRERGTPGSPGGLATGIQLSGATGGFAPSVAASPGGPASGHGSPVRVDMHGRASSERPAIFLSSARASPFCSVRSCSRAACAGGRSCTTCRPPDSRRCRSPACCRS